MMLLLCPKADRRLLTHYLLYMKYLFVSDIHGSRPALERVLHFFDTWHCDLLCILGDILNYGPRNGLPEGLDPKGIADLLNERASQIVAIRGNCDSEVDQMLLHFPILSDYTLLVDGGRRLFLTHGHVYTEEKRPTLGIDAFLYGHTHLWKLERQDDGVVVCNTGSVTFPKGGNVPTFAVMENGALTVFNLDGNPLKTIDF